MTIALCTETTTAMQRPNKGRGGSRGGSHGGSKRNNSPKKNNRKKGNKKEKDEESAPKGRRLSNNKWFNLIINVFNELAGGVDLQDRIVDCLPESWRPKVNNDEKDKGDNNVIKSAGQSSSNLKKFLDVVSKVINFVCKFKSTIVGLLTKKMKRFYRRQQMRMNFVEYRSHNRGMKNFKYYRRWFGKKLLQKVKAASKKAGAAIVKGAKKAVRVIKKVAESVKNLALTIVRELKDIFSTFVAKIKQIINNPIIQRIIKIIKCAKEFVGHARGIVDIILGIIDRVRIVVQAIASQTYVGLVKVLIDLICNFDHFRAAIEHLVSAIKEKNTLQKYIKFGKFIGKLLYALGLGGKKGKKKGGKGGKTGKSGKGGKSASRRPSKSSGKGKKKQKKL